MTSSRVELLLNATPPAFHKDLRAHPNLAAWLDHAFQCAAETPLDVSDEALTSALGAAIAAGLEPSTINVADLVLARACGRADAAALRVFVARYGSDLDRAIARSPTLGLAADEFRQLVFDRLFVRQPASPPKIESYAGKGPLKSWVRVIASRLVIDLARGRDRQTHLDGGLADKLEAAADTELSMLRTHYGPALDDAFSSAIAGLSVRQRNLLRQRYLQNLSAEALAKMYSVHRSTVFLWLDQARARMQELLQARLVDLVPGDRLHSVVGVLGSRLDLSVRRILDSQLEPDAR